MRQEKNLYYREIFGRDNLFTKAIFDFFMKIASYPRLLLEVFLRKNMGERYFSLATAITIAVLLLAYPIVINQGFSVRPSAADVYAYYSGETSTFARPSFLGKYAIWYLFTGGFIYMMILRYKEVRRNPSVFDFGRFSLSAGDIHDFFYTFKFFAKKANPRIIATLYEPAVAFIIGLVLYLVGQNIGLVIGVAAICYSLSYAGEYKKGDDFVMDMIDEMIMNEEMEDAFVNDTDAENSRGVRFYMNKPSDRELRKKLAETFIEKEETAYVL